MTRQRNNRAPENCTLYSPYQHENMRLVCASVKPLKEIKTFPLKKHLVTDAQVRQALLDIAHYARVRHVPDHEQVILFEQGAFYAHITLEPAAWRRFRNQAARLGLHSTITKKGDIPTPEHVRHLLAS